MSVHPFNLLLRILVVQFDFYHHVFVINFVVHAVSLILITLFLLISYDVSTSSSSSQLLPSTKPAITHLYTAHNVR